MKMTAAHMEACKTGSSEIHNNREKELDYARKDLSHLNESEVLESISDRLAYVKKVYKEATGQKLQDKAAPIQEVVLVIDESTTMEQVKEFGRLCQEHLGMTPFQYYIHRDEGHYDNLLEQSGWKPNYHAHIVFDTTCYEHKMVKRQKKVNGKNVKDDDGNQVFIEVDGYGKTIKFQKQHLSLMQDLAAQATGLERGIPSTKKHLSALQFKCVQMLEELKENMAKVEESKQELADIRGEIRKEKFKAAAADAGTAVLNAISTIFGGNKAKEQAKVIETLQNEMKSATDEKNQEIQEIHEQYKSQIHKLESKIEEQDKIINQFTAVFPHAKNCVANYVTLSKMGLSKEEIKTLMTGAALTYTGSLKDPNDTKRPYQVENVDIRIADSTTGKTLPWLNQTSVAKFFSDLARKIRESFKIKNMKETIIGDVLTFEEHPTYKGEYVAKWRGYTVATAAVQQNGRVEITEWHPDGESTSYTSAANLDAAWRHIKEYTRSTFDDELKEYLGQGKGFHR